MAAAVRPQPAAERDRVGPYARSSREAPRHTTPGCRWPGPLGSPSSFSPPPLPCTRRRRPNEHSLPGAALEASYTPCAVPPKAGPVVRGAPSGRRGNVGTWASGRPSKQSVELSPDPTRPTVGLLTTGIGHVDASRITFMRGGRRLGFPREIRPYRRRRAPRQTKYCWLHNAISTYILFRARPDSERGRRSVPASTKSSVTGLASAIADYLPRWVAQPSCRCRSMSGYSLPRPLFSGSRISLFSYGDAPWKSFLSRPVNPLRLRHQCDLVCCTGSCVKRIRPPPPEVLATTRSNGAPAAVGPARPMSLGCWPT